VARIPAWGGRRVARITAMVLAARGTTCHLCGLPGADSPDHDPPRSVLIASGVPDPDALTYLFPSHLLCNKRRRARPITPELRAELRAARQRDIGGDAAGNHISPRFARRRAEQANLLRPSNPGGRTPAASIPEELRKNG
jgi:hypothetical protein